VGLVATFKNSSRRYLQTDETHLPTKHFNVIQHCETFHFARTNIRHFLLQQREKNFSRF